MEELITIFDISSNKPSEFNIDKGSVEYIISKEDFWVKYPKENLNDIEYEVKNNIIHIKANKDNIKFTVNLYNLEECRLSLGAGVMNIKDICKNSDFNLGAGVIDTAFAMNNIKNFSAKLNMGEIKNNSSYKINLSKELLFKSLTYKNNGDYNVNIHLNSGIININR